MTAAALPSVRPRIWSAQGAIAGVAGGLVFGLAHIELGSLTTIASIVRVESRAVGFFVHMAIAAIVGATFSLFVQRQRAGVGETLLWGLAYGAFFWFIGPLTLLPSFLGDGVNWTVPAAQGAFPSLMGHLLYGATAALALVALRRRPMAKPSTGDLVGGILAGLLAAWITGLLLDAQGWLPRFTALPADAHTAVAWLTLLATGLLSGALYATIYGGRDTGPGPALVRGLAFGFLWWVVVARTVLPLLGADKLPWRITELREDYATLVAYLLFGAFLAFWNGRLRSLWRLLFADPVTRTDEEGPGARGLRAIGRGAEAGVLGGLVFTVVMLQVGALEGVASLIRSDSATTGFFVHLVIATIIGSSYGILFREQSLDLGSALGWGLSYGFFWWLLGPQTLAPLIRGFAPNWSADVSGALTANLVGHLGYGIAVALVAFHYERKFNPWWIARRVTDAARVARRRDLLLTSAPALWALVVFLAIALPVFLGTPPDGAPATPGDAAYPDAQPPTEPTVYP